jgi:hypothetical protein
MTGTSTKSRPVYSASNAVAALANALSQIKVEDDLTDEDMGAILGKSADRVRSYRQGLSCMDAITFGRAKREWNGRFTGDFDRLCVESRPARHTDRECESHVLKAALALSVALADDNSITPDEIRANRPTIEAARDALTSLLGKLKLEVA